MILKHRRFGIAVRLKWLRRRIFARGSETGFLMLAILCGLMAGGVVSLVSFISHMLHCLLYRVPTYSGLSGSEIARGWPLLAIPVCGGLLTAIFTALRRRRGAIVDPIEANALYGGRMSFTDSIWLTLQNLASNGFGLSAGLEAAYTQLSSGLASKFGLKLKLRREDMRVLVGCGSAGAIAAAFGAPLTGAFYAFELIIGSYSTVSLAPVIAAAITATLVVRALSAPTFEISIQPIGQISALDFPPALMVGAICAGCGILLMIAVARTEKLAARSRLPVWLRPLLGGLLVGLLAWITPQVLSAGHGALHMNLENDVTLQGLLVLFMLKALASALTIGWGFRGGLFFASLLLGVLIGKAAAMPIEWLLPHVPPASVMAIIGMSAFGVAVIGGPLTMTFLALELTGEFQIGALVLAASIMSSLVVRQTFGYSFSTWRFHLRGETIRSAHDVGWIRNLTVGTLMRRDVVVAPCDMTPDAFRAAFPLGSTQRVAIVDANGSYCAMIFVAEIHADIAAPEPEPQLEHFFRLRGDVLLPGMNARQAVGLFDSSRSEALAVVSDRIERRVIGLLSEAHTLRRYSEELEKRRQEATGATE